MRVVSGTGGGTGGTTAFTSVFTSRTPSGSVTMNNAAFTLTTNEMPSHSHYMSEVYTGTNGPFAIIGQDSGAGGGPYNTGSTGGGGSHTHANTASFSGTALDFAVQYIDIILCSKN
jgi:hypothetical protein